MTATVHIDGAARGNPGPAAFAFVISRDGEPPVEEKGRLGTATNNVAEYTALVNALRRAAELGERRLSVLSDSELLVKQMNGLYRVKNEDLRALYEDAKRLCDRFEVVTIRHVPRAANSRADRLCNEALDEGREKPKAPPGRRVERSGRGTAVDAAAVHEEAVRCLRAAAASWSRGDPNPPSAEQVWEQLCSVLEEHGALHPALAGGRGNRPGGQSRDTSR
jgi:ribonuclease HI